MLRASHVERMIHEFSLVGWQRCILLVCATVFVAQGQTLLTRVPGAPFDAGPGPYGAVTADLNNDGIPDLAFAAYGSSSITVLLGDGAGGFIPAPGSPFRAGTETLTVIAGDFNGDGVTDLAGLSTLAGPMYLGQGEIVVLFGDGHGSFIPPAFNTVFPPPSHLTRGFPTDFVSADLNHDGKTDIVIAVGGGFLALLSDGTGGFNIAPGSPYPANPDGIALGDFDRDGRVDVAVTNSTKHSVAVYFGDGTGGFKAGPETELPGSGRLSSVIAADWNNDRIPDLAVALGDSGVVILLGNGKGGFQFTSAPAVPTAYGRQPFTISDFNGDGNTDLFVSNGRGALLLLGNGNGTFQPSQGFALGEYLGFLVAGDYNLDGKPDIASSTGIVWLNSLPTLPVTVSLHFQASAGGPSPKPIAVSAGPAAGLVAKSDQPWAGIANSQVTVNTAGLKPGHYDATIRLTAPSYFGSAIRVSLDIAAPSGLLTFHSSEPEPLLPLGDFNNDGKPDLLRLSGGDLFIGLNDGSANFPDSGLRFPLTLGVGGPALGDFDGDGNLDVAIVGENGIAFYPGDGTGNLRPGRPSSVGSNVSAYQLLVADFNGDGFLDIATASALHPPLQIFLGDGRGGFREIPNAAPTLPANAAQLVLGDFNSDGKLDIACSEYGIGNVYLLLGDGAGRFQNSQTLSFGANGFTEIAGGDWNGDGNLDLAVRNWRGLSDSYLTFYSGNGQGQLAKTYELSYPNPRLVGAVVPADIDGDGNLDLLIGLYDQTVDLLLGDGKGGFTPSPGGPIGKGFNAEVADLNGDGRTDVIIRGPDQFSVYLNGLASPTIALTQGAPNPFTAGQTVSLTVSVTAASGAFRVPTGSVTLFDGQTRVATMSLVNGTASFLTRYVPGTHNFRAVYNGDTRSATGDTTLSLVETGSPAAVYPLSNAQPFRVLVTDANNNPVSGVGVVFTAPSSGPSGTFGSANSTVAITDDAGVATAGPFILNKISGLFTITVTVSGYPGPSAVIPLQNKGAGT